MNKQITFDFFRYQILPISQYIQLHLFKSYEDSITNENVYFSTAIFNAIYTSRRQTLRKEIKEIGKDFYRIRLGKEINIEKYREDFSLEIISSFPPTTIFLDNNKNFQTISIQQNSANFTGSIINIISRAINSLMKAHSLVVKIEPIFYPKSFWQFIGENRQSIKYVDFSLITPNMSNISSSLSKDLCDAAQSTKAIKTNIKFQSETGSTLDINEDNNRIDDFVIYASKGGGRILVKGLTAKYDSQKQQKTFSIDSLEGDLNDIIKFIRALSNE
jgi:hypothetical protein